MEIKSSWMVLVSIIVIFILTGYTLFIYNRYRTTIPGEENQSETQTGTPAGTSYQLDPAYPRDMIEGFIKSAEIELPKGKFGVKVNINKIFLDELSFTKEVTVLTDKETEFALYELEIGKESSLTIEDFKIGTSVLITIKGTNDNILSQKTFTAIKMMKMLILPPNNMQ
ncbi:MAG: hypothetical protein ACKKMV_01600 [Candidatus Nealsonbacteria bacterium]